MAAGLIISAEIFINIYYSFFQLKLITHVFEVFVAMTVEILFVYWFSP
jgi:hypothetical protein